MTKTAIREQVQALENNTGGTFPPVYKRFLIEEVGDWTVYELSWQSGSEERRMDVYNVEEVFERNEAYEVQQWASGYWLIGQDGDMGYFICIAPGEAGDVVYSLDLGTLGSAEMAVVAPSIAHLAQTAELHTQR